MVQICARGLKPKQVWNEPALICVSVRETVCVCECDSGMTRLADAYQCACLALLFLFVFGKREQQVCVFVWGKAQTAFIVSCFSVTCLPNCPPAKPGQTCPHPSLILFYYHLSHCPRLKRKKNNFSNTVK